MTGLWDAERDASEAVRALAGLAALLREDGTVDRRRLLAMTENSGAAMERVAAYLRRQCRPGDGEMTAVPPRLSAWRDWMPPRGDLFGTSGAPHRTDGVPQPRRCDPGE